ncbi:MAG TPA: protein-disulfide reductase DsbD [Gammaproteobacteria bacterium]|nr:protein-disulfide reductase DsbD [Gammaproteobacteria bacterium]
MRYWLLVLLTGWFSVTHAGLFGDDELLPPDKAFAFEASVVSADRIRVVWTIADGYYLYRDKFHFATDATGISFGNPAFPAGKIKQDEFFGKVETYRKRVAIEIPVIRAPGAATKFELKATSQGCADLGVCYPPHTQLASLDLPADKTVAKKSGGALQALSDLGTGFGFGNAEDELLPPDQAFQLDVQVTDANTLTANWTIAEGYYLYRHQFGFEIKPTEGVTLLPAQIPDGVHKTDEYFGDIQAYHGEARATLPVQRTSSEATPVVLTVKYQGCADRGVCYPPITKTLNLLLPAASAATLASPGSASSPPTHGLLSEQDAIAKRLSEGNLLVTLLGFFGLGLLLAFTPCVFPMIPILSSIIVGQGEKITARRGFVLSSVYVLAMALTYTVAGVIAGVFGENLQAAFQNPWILSTFAAVFVLLSLSMFGFYELQMPAFIQSKLTETSNRQKGGNLTGVAVMGFLSALIVGPCVAAPLAGALIYIGQTGDAVLGGLALFVLSLGMGAPLIAIGTGAGKILPAAGPWMDSIKAVFGVMLLAVAIWMLERILPGPVTLVLWATLLILSAVYLRALDGLAVEATGWSRLWKGTGVVSLVYGILLLIGAASGAHDPMQPLQNLFVAQSSGTAHRGQLAELPFKRIKTVDDLDHELADAARQGKPVMVDFYADWCTTCKEMEKYTFAKPEVQQALAGMVLLQADVTANDDADKALLKRFKLIGPPSILFFDATGKERKELNLVGYIPADEFVQHVQVLR